MHIFLILSVLFSPPVIAFSLFSIVELGEKLAEEFGANKLNLPYSNQLNKRILRNVLQISNNVNRLIDDFDDNSEQLRIDQSFASLSNEIELRHYFNKLNKLIFRIDHEYKDFFSYQNVNLSGISEISFENWTILEHAENIVSHNSNSIRASLWDLYNIFHPDTNQFLQRSFFLTFFDTLKKSESIKCSLKQSPSQFIESLYQLVAFTEMKGYAVIEFSYTLLKLLKKGDFKKEKKFECEKHWERLNGLSNAAVKALRKTSTEYYRCNPMRFEKNKNYAEVTELLQGYIENEVDMNAEQSCSHSCDYYEVAENHGCLNQPHCKQFKRCNGQVRNCHFIDSDMTICPSIEPSKSNRRYDFIEYENGEKFGRAKECSAKTVETESWWRWLFWHCSYCMCVCDEQGLNSDRYFALNNVLSDSKNNKVITGIKFTKKNRVLFLQIQQGKLQTNGTIEKNSIEWVPVPDIYTNSTKFKDGRDFHTLTYNSRAVDLDDLHGKNFEVLTGVRFGMIGSHLNFQIQITPFDFNSGNLDLSKQMWIQNFETDVSSNPRTKLSLENRDLPTKTSKHESLPDSQANQYLQFTHTGFKQDAAQTTVPFIDLQEVMPVVPTPLTGAGLYHRGAPDLGGFLALKVFTYNYSDHLAQLDFNSKQTCQSSITHTS